MWSVCVCVWQVQRVKMQMMCSVGGTWEMYIFFSPPYMMWRTQLKSLTLEWFSEMRKCDFLDELASLSPPS